MSNPMKARYEELARQAGVSLATVYRVMNRGGSASAETEARVREVAKSMGLTQQRRAKARLVGFLLGNRALDHPFHSRILAGAEATCVQHGYNVLVLTLRYATASSGEGNLRKQLHLPRVLELHGLVDGFVVTGFNSQTLLDLLAHMGLPYAVQGNSVRDPWLRTACDGVFFDDVAGSEEIARYLLSLGHRDIWFVGNRQLPSLDRSYNAFERVVAGAGLRARAEGFDTEDAREAGYLGTRSIISRGDPVTAIFAGSDPTAIGVYDALRECGKRVPDDISVVGFDDVEAGALYPPLTSAHIYLEEIGKKLAELVLGRIDNPDLAPQQVSVPTRLIRRASCGAPPAQAAGPPSRKAAGKGS